MKQEVLPLLPEGQPLPRNRSPVLYRKFYIHRGKGIKQVKTICEVLRKLYRNAADRNDAVSMTDIGEAFDMAKRMQAKLKQYGAKANDPVYLIADDKEGMLWLTKHDFIDRDEGRKGQK